MKPHLVVHSIVIGCLGAFAAVAVMSEAVHMNRTLFFSLIPFAFAFFGACFGIRKTSRYSKNIAGGCEVTVTTAEAKVFPYVFYVVSIVFTIIRVIT